MIGKININYLILIPALLIVLLVYSLIYFTYPSVDDYAVWFNLSKYGFWGNQKHLYLTWSGRYTSNALISVSPNIISNLWLYRISLFVQLSIVLFSLWYLMTHIIHKNGASTITCTLLVFVSLFACQANPAQGMYWFTGVYTYTISVFFYIVGLLFLIKFISTNDLKQYSISLLSSIWIIGLNETALIIYIYSIACIYLLAVMYNKKLLSNKSLWIYLIVVIIFSLISILSEGNFMRKQEFEYNDIGLLNAIKASIKSSIKLYLDNSIVFITLTGLIVLNSTHQSLLRNGAFYIGIFLHPFLLLCVSFIPAFIATGIHPPLRVTNIQIQLIIISYLIIYYYQLQQSVIYNRQSNNHIILYCMCIVSFNYFITNKNIQYLVEDYLNSKYFNYKMEQVNRIEKIETSNTLDDISVSPFESKPYLIFNDDIKMDSANWRNRCFAEFYHLRTIYLKNN